MHEIPPTLIEAFQQAQVVQDVLLDYGVETEIVYEEWAPLSLWLDLTKNYPHFHGGFMYLRFEENCAHFITSRPLGAPRYLLALEY